MWHDLAIAKRNCNREARYFQTVMGLLIILGRLVHDNSGTSGKSFKFSHGTCSLETRCHVPKAPSPIYLNFLSVSNLSHIAAVHTPEQTPFCPVLMNPFVKWIEKRPSADRVGVVGGAGHRNQRNNEQASSNVTVAPEPRTCVTDIS